MRLILTDLILVTLCCLSCFVHAAPAASFADDEQDQVRIKCSPLRRPGMDSIIVGYEVGSDCGKCICTRENYLVCEGCKDCQVHKKFYRHSQTWWNDCNECTCTNGAISCQEKLCPGTCVYRGATKLIGEQWKDECNTCICKEGGTSCTQTQCHCDYEGVQRNHQERWQKDGEWCTCLSGTVIGFACMFNNNVNNNIMDFLDMDDF